MKLLLLLVTAPLLAQTPPDCTYTLQHAPGGSIIVHRNGVALIEADYTRSGAGGLRTVALNGWNDGDLIMIYYAYGVGTPIPGTTPPSKVTIYIPTKEYKTCVGTQNPPPPPPFVPYKGATQDLDLGQHSLHTLFTIPTGVAPNPSRVWFTAGQPPTDTVFQGVAQDAVVYLDATDNNLKVLRKDGTLQPPALFTVSLSLTQPTGAAPGATISVPLNLQGIVQPAGVQWTIVYDPTVITSLAVAPGPAATAAAKTISCAGTGSMMCLATGINTNTIAPGVLAVLTLTISPTAVSGSRFGLGLTNLLSASLSGDGIPTGGGGISVLLP